MKKKLQEKLGQLIFNLGQTELQIQGLQKQKEIILNELADLDDESAESNTNKKEEK